jgi:hypothetical protein
MMNPREQLPLVENGQKSFSFLSNFMMESVKHFSCGTENGSDLFINMSPFAFILSLSSVLSISYEPRVNFRYFFLASKCQSLF